MNERDRDFADAARVVSESATIASMDRALSALAATAADSAIARLLERAAAAVRETEPSERVRDVAAWIAVTSLTHMVLLRWMPPNLAPAVPLAWWIALCAAAATVAGAAGPLTIAWRHRGGGRP